jgi:hypothetical protein
MSRASFLLAVRPSGVTIWPTGLPVSVPALVCPTRSTVYVILPDEGRASAWSCGAVLAGGRS